MAVPLRTAPVPAPIAAPVTARSVVVWPQAAIARATTLTAINDTVLLMLSPLCFRGMPKSDWLASKHRRVLLRAKIKRLTFQKVARSHVGYPEHVR